MAVKALRRPAAEVTEVPSPQDLADLPAWLDYRARNHLTALPLEARLFYRRGLLAARSGDRDEAIRLVRGAADLDPGFVSPHLTLASWSLLREPSQALLQYASVIELVRQDFLLQLAIAGNALYLGFQALLLGFLAAGLLVLALHSREYRHACAERLSRLVNPGSAALWAWALLVLPFAAGFGLALPTVLCLALLWPILKAGERAVLVGLLATLLAAPWAAGSLDRLAIPLRDGPPFHGVPLMADHSPDGGDLRELSAIARDHPDDPLLQFALAWSARRQGDLSAAEAGYRRALALSPGDDRALNNLGNVLAMQGRTNEALEIYRRAGAQNPTNAGAAFNASQIYTQRYDYHAATDALSRASALNFELVKTYQSQASDDGVLPLVDEWIAPRSFWSALSHRAAEAAGRGALPPGWRSRIEFSGWGTAVIALALALFGLMAGARAQRAMPLRTCSNCGAVVCRRCACRRRETALCPACAAAEARAETPDFGRALLLQRRRAVRRREGFLRGALAMILPGYGLLAYRRVLPAVLLLSASAALAAVTVGWGAPFASQPRLAIPGQEVPVPMLVGLWVALYAVSILGYLVQVARAQAGDAALTAPVRSRIRLSDRDHSALAA